MTGKSEEDFRNDTKLQDAVMRRFEIMGEATKNLSEKFTQEHSAVQWKDITGMRDKVSHYYLGIDLNTVLETIKKDLPDLKKKLSKIKEENS